MITRKQKEVLAHIWFAVALVVLIASWSWAEDASAETMYPEGWEPEEQMYKEQLNPSQYVPTPVEEDLAVCSSYVIFASDFGVQPADGDGTALANRMFAMASILYSYRNGHGSFVRWSQTTYGSYWHEEQRQKARHAYLKSLELPEPWRTDTMVSNVVKCNDVEFEVKQKLDINQMMSTKR